MGIRFITIFICEIPILIRTRIYDYMEHSKPTLKIVTAMIPMRSQGLHSWAITTGWLTIQIRVESRRKDILDQHNILGPYPNSAKRSVSIFLYLLYYC